MITKKISSTNRYLATFFQKAKIMMPGIQLKKITRQVKKQKNVTHHEDKNQSVQTDPELI